MIGQTYTMRFHFVIKSFFVPSAILTIILCGCSKGSDPVTPVTPSAVTVTSLSSTSGSVGDTIMINGTNFSSVAASNSVQLNTTDVVVIKATATQLSVQLPSSIITGTLQVSVKVNGVSAGLSVAFTRLPRVTTFAGTGVAGYLDGNGTSAQFKNPTAMVIDGSGNLYVCDAGNNRIRKITTTGTVTTVAGNGVAGFADGAAASASFNVPNAIALDASGNLIVVDQVGQRVRKIAAGVVSTLAGNGTTGNTLGAAANASFNFPLGVAIDGTGNLYISDAGNYMVKKISTAGQVSVYCGTGIKGIADGTLTTAKFSYPAGLVFNSGGDLLIVDEHAIRKIAASSGTVTTFTGGSVAGSTDGTGVQASFNYIFGVAVDNSGNLFLTDQLNTRIRKVTSAGIVSTYAGSTSGYLDGSSTVAKFTSPAGIAVDGSGNVYVVDNGNHVIRKIVP